MPFKKVLTLQTKTVSISKAKLSHRQIANSKPRFLVNR